MKKETLIIKLAGNLDEQEKNFFLSSNAIIGKSNSLIGEEVLYEIIIVMSPLIFKQLKEILMEKTKAKKFIYFKYGDLEIKGVNEDTILKIIDKLNDKFNSKENTK
jgi:hypothetical protein